MWTGPSAAPDPGPLRNQLVWAQFLTGTATDGMLDRGFNPDLIVQTVGLRRIFYLSTALMGLGGWGVLIGETDPESF